MQCRKKETNWKLIVEKVEYKGGSTTNENKSSIGVVYLENRI